MKPRFLERPRFPNTKLRMVRLFFWASWGAMIGFPIFTFLGMPFGMGAYSEWAFPAFAVAFLGVSLTSAQLVDLQPSLARFGMGSLALGIILLFVTGALCSPVTG